jgi:hypothetical protein
MKKQAGKSKVTPILLLYIKANTQFYLARVSLKDEQTCDGRPQFSFEILGMFPLPDPIINLMTKKQSLPFVK